MIIVCLLLNFLQQKLWKLVVKSSFYDWLHDMPMGANGRGTTAQSGQQNDGVTAPNMQQSLHHRLGHINRTLYADIEKPTTLEKTFNNLTQNKFLYFYEKKLNFVEKICIWLLAQHSTVIHNKQYTTQNT